MPTIAAIDPGVSPTVCILHDEPGKPLGADFYENDDTSYGVEGTRKRRPSAPLLTQVLKIVRPDVVIIESVASMPGQGVSSTFHFGFAAGLVEGVASALSIPVVHVTPQVWKKAFRIAAGAGKAMSRHIAAQLAPHMADQFKQVSSHNRADAFLMAYWGRSRIPR